MYLTLKGCAVPLHLLPALAHTLLPLLGPEAQRVDVPFLAEGVARAIRSLDLKFHESSIPFGPAGHIWWDTFTPDLDHFWVFALANAPLTSRVCWTP